MHGTRASASLAVCTDRAHGRAQMETLVRVGQTLGRATGIDARLNETNYAQVVSAWEEDFSDSSDDTDTELLIDAQPEPPTSALPVQ